MLILSSLQLDTLKEIGTIGAGNAASGLSILVNNRVEISIPKVQFLALQEVANSLGYAEQPVCAIYLELKGEINGFAMLIFSQGNAANLVNLMLNQEKISGDIFNEYEKSALKELGNISAAAYLNALAGLTGFKITCSIPYFAMDMLGAVLDQVLAAIATEVDYAVLIETAFSIGQSNVNGYFLLLPNIEGLKMILKKLHV